MRSALAPLRVFSLVGCLILLTSLPHALKSSPTFADQLVSDEKLQVIEAVHKQSIGRLHGLHHEMRATLKQLTRGRGDQEAAQQLTAQLGAVRQTLDTVAETEKDHPQWANSWSHRHARLVVLTREMEALLLTRPSSQDGSRTHDQLEKKLQEVKEILDVW